MGAKTSKMEGTVHANRIHCFSKSFLSCSGAVVPSHPCAACDPPGPEVRQHFHHGAHRQRQDWRPRPRHPQEQVIRQERHR
jgi:hypothetical protein